MATEFLACVSTKQVGCKRLFCAAVRASPKWPSSFPKTFSFLLLVVCYLGIPVCTFKQPVKASVPHLTVFVWKKRICSCLRNTSQQYHVSRTFPPAASTCPVFFSCPVPHDGKRSMMLAVERSAALGKSGEEQEHGFCHTADALAEPAASGASRMDHRTLGVTMKLFCFLKPRSNSMSGLGPALLPRGQTLMTQLQSAVRKLQQDQGFDEVC